MHREGGEAVGHEGKGIPMVVIRRLPVYQRYLDELNRLGIERISSPELAKRIGITASQLRQDLSWFGSFGLQGYGYNVAELLSAINVIIGLNDENTMVLMGYGNLGRAIAGYEGFRRRNFNLLAAFDPEEKRWGMTDYGIPVYGLDKLHGFLKEHPVTIGIITTPAEGAQQAVDTLVAGGVKGIWNFAPVRLNVPPDVVVEHLHLANSLMTLSLKLRQHVASSTGNT